MEYRKLTAEEICTLEDNGCWAEDWSAVDVAEEFQPGHLSHVRFYGDIRLGVFERYVEVSMGFQKHSGIANATLRNACVGDNCLIENIGCHINNYTIGNDCYISNVCTMETTDGATYGEGNLIATLNEAGSGNITLFSGLTNQLAAFMAAHYQDKTLKDAMRRLLNEHLLMTLPDCGTIGNGAKITNCKQITNTIVGDDCEICGASLLSDCTIMSTPEAAAYIGIDVTCENTIVACGASLVGGVRVQDCYVGEACQLCNGFTANNSVFFANCYMSAGEACAAFCGPFCTCHHKNTLLLSCAMSMCNAGPATCFDNYGHKLGPLHHGTLGRGCNTTCGTVLSLPARIGVFSTCQGMISCHPDTRALPFSTVVAQGDTVSVQPAINITSAGLYRDLHKWAKRDMRPKANRRSVVDMHWLSPYTMGYVLQGLHTLQALLKASGDNTPEYHYNECCISAKALHQGIKNYDMCLRMYMGAALEQHGLMSPDSDHATGAWRDLAGMLMPEQEEQRLVDDIKDGNIGSMQAVAARLDDIGARYAEYSWAWTYHLMQQYYGLDTITRDDAELIRKDYAAARQAWMESIKQDAQREFELGDMDEEALMAFCSLLDSELAQCHETGNATATA